MSTARATESATLPYRWTIRLPCGHEIDVPWGSPVPAQMACVVHHHSECGEPVDSFISAWWGPSLHGPGARDDR